MIDLLYLAKGRPEFTVASLRMLFENTALSNVRLIVYSDGPASAELRAELAPWIDLVPVSLNESVFGGPVGVMNHYLMKQRPSDIFIKLDNDVIVPAGWLERGLRVMEENPALDLLGIEAPSSAVRIHLSATGLGYTLTDAIGGIGFMRRRAFAGRDSMHPHSTYGGFTEWQLKHLDILKGWITPPLKTFLLDRLPFEPWLSLSRRYIAQGVQRPWPMYNASDAHLWSWWSA